MEYFFDSSVILEIIDKNEAYSKFQDLTITTTTLNLAEVHNVLLRVHNIQTADYWASRLDFYFLAITPEIAIEASKFRHQHKKENLSYADCIGYVIAKENNLLFLTNDSRFKGKKKVEFVE